MKTRILSSLLIATSLSACGGGGGGGGGPSISPPTRIDMGSIANASVSIGFVSQEFISVLRNISEDNKADAKETLGVFQWITNNASKINIDELAQYQITVDGVTMGLDSAWNKLLGYKKVYYDGKETFWNDVAEKGQLDDESDAYTDIKTVVDNKDLIDFEKVGKGEEKIEDVKEKIKKKKQEVKEKKEEEAKKKEEEKKKTPTPPKVVETSRNTVDDVTTSDEKVTVVADPVVIITYNDIDTSVKQDNGDEIFTKTRHFLDTSTTTTTVTTKTTTSTVKVLTINYSDGTSKVTRNVPVITIKNVPVSADVITTAKRTKVIETWTVKAEVFETGRLTKPEIITTIADPVVVNSEAVITTTYADKVTTVTADNGDQTITTTRHFIDTSTVVKKTTITTTIKTVAVTTINYSDSTKTVTRAEPTYTTTDAITNDNVVTTLERTQVIGTEFKKAEPKDEVTITDTKVELSNWYWLRLDTTYLTPVVLTTSTKSTQVGTTVTVTRYDTIYTPEIHTHVDARDTTTTVTYSNSTNKVTKTTEEKNRSAVTKHPTNRAIETATVIRTYEVAIEDEKVYDSSDDRYLGTKTPGYNADANSYKTSEYSYVSNDAKSSSNFSSAYSRGWTGTGSKIVIADTGIDTTHTEFNGQIADSIDYTGQGMGVDSLHGTHVSGIAAGKKDGVGSHGAAFDAKILSAKVSSGYRYSFQNAKYAAEWGRNKGAVAINVSAEVSLDRSFQNSIIKQGSGNYYSNHYYYGINGYNGAKQEAEGWKTALGSEMVLVKAAGNAGRDFSAGMNQMATATDSNGNLILDGQMLVVGNWDTNNDKIAGSSNQAGNVCVTFVDGVCKDAKMIKDFFIMADGTSITNAKAGGGYVTMTGTSMSAPVVTGAVAVLHQMWPHMKGKNLVQLVLVTGDKNITNYNENVHGQGLLDMNTATQPVGGVGIPKTGRVDGGVSNISGGAAINGGASGITALSSIMVVDSFDRDFYVDLTSMVQATDTRTLSAVEAMGGDINYYAGYMNNQQHATVPFKLNDYASVVIGSGKSDNHYLGNNMNGSLGTTEDSYTSYANFNASAYKNNYKLYGQVGLGVSKVNYDTTDSIMVDNDLAYSSTWTVGAEKTYVVSEASYTFGATISQPVTVESANVTYNIATSVDNNGNLNYSNQDVNFASDKREIDVGAYYKYSKGNTDFNIFGEIRNNVAAISSGIDQKIGFTITHKF
jgi:subtilisin family serine protease